jgi:hypothetical protein
MPATRRYRAAAGQERGAQGAVNERRRPGSAQQLDTLGSFDHCWCGELKNHPWPGQEDGRPHPPIDRETTS